MRIPKTHNNNIASPVRPGVTSVAALVCCLCTQLPMAVQSKLNPSNVFKMTDPNIPQPPTPTPTHVCGWCGLQVAFAINTLCPSCEVEDQAQVTWSLFQAWQNEVEQGMPNFEDEEENPPIFNCMLCGATTTSLTSHDRLVNGEWETEYLPFCNAMHHAIYSLNLPH